MLTRLRNWLRRRRTAPDPWERMPYAASPTMFGRGSQHPFPWYFEGESSVVVRSVDDVCAYLLQCEYVPDDDLFNEADFWQHPRTFEKLRQGDCEDHALWAWRKLVELGLDAELVSGVQRGAESSVSHVWVRFRDAAGREFILEGVTRDRERMVRPFEQAKGDYVPHAGVDRAFTLHCYSGYLRGR